MNRPNVKFVLNASTPELFEGTLKPAVTALPEWYRSMPKRMKGFNHEGMVDGNPDTTTSTLKGCPPFLDAMMTGYVLKTPAEIQFLYDEQSDLITYQWRVMSDVPLVSTHPKEQVPNVTISHSFFDALFKFGNSFTIQTPPGYSCYFTHPANRFDLPFHTLAGVVDTDEYPLPVQFPFLLKRWGSNELTLPAGTPFVQIIPFKREEWQSIDLGRKTTAQQNSDKNALFRLIAKSYKRQWWHRKSYS